MRSLGATPLRRALLRVALYGGALFVGIPLAFAHVMTASHRAAAVAVPPSGYEELAIPSEEGLQLRAWLARGDRERSAAVVVHGLGDSLESYLDHARVLRERGHGVLLLDLRGHGGSGGSYTALGAREHADVVAAMDELRRRDMAARGILLEGHSMGAVAVLLAASRASDVRGVIAEAPYDTYRGSIEHHARLLFGIPRWVPLIPIAIAAAEWRAGFDADEVDVVAAAARIDAPLLAIADGADPRMPEPVVRRVYDAHPGPKSFWVAPGVDHVGAIRLAEYGSRVRCFLEENGL